MRTDLVTDVGAGGTATFSVCRRYRYLLTRGDPSAQHSIVFVMLNPSKADADETDRTLEQCLKFARRTAREAGWTSHCLAIVNLYGLVSTDPSGLRNTRDPIGPANDEIVVRTCVAASTVICGWSRKGRRGSEMREMLVAAGVPLFHLGNLNADGSPRHPSRLADATPLRGWNATYAHSTRRRSSAFRGR